MRPADVATASLQNRLKKALLEREFEKQYTLGEAAQQRDDWQAAQTHFQQAQKLRPNDRNATENYNLAARITAAGKYITRILDEEHRLGDKNVSASVVEHMHGYEALMENSAQLQKLYDELRHKVLAYQTEVPVTVVSDGKTHIIVRGQGQIGKTNQRTIQLFPGRHVFEGSRAGYKSRLVTVIIPPGAIGTSVTVVCDEKI